MAANLNYYTSEEAFDFNFIRMPTVLFDDPDFYNLSDGARILYSFLYDRMSLSAKNGWWDEDDHVYIVYTIAEVMDRLHWAKEKACRVMSELEEYGLIERSRPNRISAYRIYVKKISSNTRFENRTSRGSKIELHEVRKSNPNHTNNNHTNNFNNSILSNHEVYEAPDYDEMDAIGDTTTVNNIKSQINYDELMIDYDNNPIIDEIVELMADVYSYSHDKLFISGSMRPKADVLRRLFKIDFGIMQYILDNLQICDSQIRNIKGYLLATLYNAPVTMGAYYLTKVNADMKKQAEEKAGDSS